MASPRALHTATLFPNGKVLVVGGDVWFYSANGAPQSVATADLYDPATGLFSRLRVWCFGPLFCDCGIHVFKSEQLALGSGTYFRAWAMEALRDDYPVYG
jgi:Galactose oxidase, central domain